jgi:pilus assembly protein CpaC
MFKMRSFAWVVISGLLLMACGLLHAADAAVIPAGPLLKMEVIIGKSQVLAFTENITRVSVTDPNIADVMVASPRQLLINGKAAGTTSMVVWDSEDRPTFYDLVVHTDTSFQQVMLKVRFAEVNRTAMKNLGVDFATTDFNPSLFGEDFERLTMGSYSGLVATPSFGRDIPGQPTLPALSLTSGVSLFLSLVHRSYDASAILKALEKKGYVNTLAEPTLVAISGHQAKFLAGGEIPVPVATPTEGVKIEWKEFGVSLTFTPIVVDSGVVNLKVEPEVSTLDWDNGVVLSGFRIPALRTRKASSTMELRDGQTLVMAGLISSEDIKGASKLPILGDIPILGALFRSTNFMKNESELVLLVTPKIVTSYSASEVPAWPGTGKASGEE